eukprot:scaffold6888_cov48-Attheya_sp.AAC.1
MPRRHPNVKTQRSPHHRPQQNPSPRRSATNAESPRDHRRQVERQQMDHDEDYDLSTIATPDDDTYLNSPSGPIIVKGDIGKDMSKGNKFKEKPKRGNPQPRERKRAQSTPVGYAEDDDDDEDISQVSTMDSEDSMGVIDRFKKIFNCVDESNLVAEKRRMKAERTEHLMEDEIPPPGSEAFHVFGRNVDEAGNTYEGQFLGGIRDGFGTIHYVETNDRYEGQWFNDKPHGPGKLVMGDGIGNFEGVWHKGTLSQVKQGVASVIDDDGNEYNGSFLAWEKHGEGTLGKVDGETYVGTWKRGLRHGEGEIVHPDGSRFAGTFVNDKLVDETIRVVVGSHSEESSTHSQGLQPSHDSQDSQQSHDSQDSQHPHDSQQPQDAQQPQDSQQPNQPQISDESNTMMGGLSQSMSGNVPLDPEKAIKKLRKDKKQLAKAQTNIVKLKKKQDEARRKIEMKQIKTRSKARYGVLTEEQRKELFALEDEKIRQERYFIELEAAQRQEIICRIRDIEDLQAEATKLEQMRRQSQYGPNIMPNKEFEAYQNDLRLLYQQAKELEVGHGQMYGQQRFGMDNNLKARGSVYYAIEPIGEKIKSSIKKSGKKLFKAARRNSFSVPKAYKSQLGAPPVSNGNGIGGYNFSPSPSAMMKGVHSDMENPANQMMNQRDPSTPPTVSAHSNSFPSTGVNDEYPDMDYPHGSRTDRSSHRGNNGGLGSNGKQLSSQSSAERDIYANVPLPQSRGKSSSRPDDRKRDENASHAHSTPSSAHKPPRGKRSSSGSHEQSFASPSEKVPMNREDRRRSRSGSHEKPISSPPEKSTRKHDDRRRSGSGTHDHRDQSVSSPPEKGPRKRDDQRRGNRGSHEKSFSSPSERGPRPSPHGRPRDPRFSGSMSEKHSSKRSSKTKDRNENDQNHGNDQDSYYSHNEKEVVGDVLKSSRHRSGGQTPGSGDHRSKKQGRSREERKSIEPVPDPTPQFFPYANDDPHDEDMLTIQAPPPLQVSRRRSSSSRNTPRERGDRHSGRGHQEHPTGGYNHGYVQ